MGLREQMDRIYRDTPLNNIPWNEDEPPELLVEAVESGKITPCRAVDLGCGAGNHSVWLAQEGFEVTGIDFSEEAITHARTLAESESVSCQFVAADLLGDLSAYNEEFDFAFDWEVLHHIFPEDRPEYIQNVYSLLRPGGLYFSLCFSELDAAFGGDGKHRDTPLGTKLYFSSEAELRELFEPLFTVLDLATVEISGKLGTHAAIAAWLIKT